jgi:hypothetical protein
MTGDGAALTDYQAMRAIPVGRNSRIKAACANSALVSRALCQVFTFNRRSTMNQPAKETRASQ